MRKDMDRKVIERPRTGGHAPKGTGRGKDSRDLENLPTKEGMKRRWHDRKEQSDNLAPFYRFLDKQVGRPWDKVYSEIRERISAKSVIQMHILEHLESHVELHATIGEDGIPRASRWGRGYEIEGLYVCPNTGLLKSRPKAPRYRNRTEEESANYLIIDDKRYIEGPHGWSELQLESAHRNWMRNPTGEWGRHYSVPDEYGQWDALHKKFMSILELHEFYGRDVRCDSHRPLNKKEIRDLGLRK